MPNTQHATKLLHIAMLNIHGSLLSCVCVAALNYFSTSKAMKGYANLKGLNFCRNGFSMEQNFSQH